MSKSDIDKILKLGKKKKLKKLLRYFATDQEENVVEAVFEAIGSIKSPDAVTELCTKMQSENTAVRKMAANALAVASSYKDIEKLRHFAGIEKDEQVKSILNEAAIRLNESAPKDELE